MLQFSDISRQSVCWVETVLGSKGTDEIVSSFTEAIQSQAFAERFALLGYPDIVFHKNHWIERRGPGYQKFHNSFKGPRQKLGLVFHGTQQENIAPILKDGLDKSMRNGQAYGPGEYFGRSPGIAESYARGGFEILVFVVVLSGRGSCLDNIVVVEDNSDHLALGTIQFQDVSIPRPVAALNQQQRRQYAGLNKQIEDKAKSRQQICCKGTIVQELLLCNLEVASALYCKWESALDDNSKKEISWYVHLRLSKRRERSKAMARNVLGISESYYRAIFACVLQELIAVAVVRKYYPCLPIPMSLENVLLLRAQTLCEAALPNPEIYHHLRHPSTPHKSKVQNMISKYPNLRNIPTYTTPLGQRAFRIPPVKISKSPASSYHSSDR